MKAAGTRPWSDMTVAEARAGVEAVVSKDVEPIPHVEDRAIRGPDGSRLTLRLYRPSPTQGLPFVVFFHGSGFVMCSLDTHDGQCRALANRSGALVVSVDYRLAPENPYPAAAEDCYAAVRWIHENATSFGGDGSRIAVAGDSAGGNLAAVTALMARDRRVPPLSFQLLIYPVLDAGLNTPSFEENAEGYGLSKPTMAWFWSHYLPSPSLGDEPYASPLRARDLSGLPPALVITAEYDLLRDEGEAYAARLREAGVDARASRYDGMQHGFFEPNLGFEVAKAGMGEAADALRRALAG